MSSDKYWSQFHALQSIRANLVRLIDVSVKLDVKNCLACEHFDEPNEICRKYGQRPPARIIANGCESFENNEDIPF